MGNEMGNNNVSGLQEQDKTDVEAPNTSQDFHEKESRVTSVEEPSGVSDPHIQKESSEIREPDKTKVQASDGTSEAPLVSKDKDSAIETNPSGTSNHQKEKSVGKEGEESKKSSLDTQSSTQATDSMESVSQPAEPWMKDGNNLQGSNEGIILGSYASHVIEKKEQKLHDISTVEVAKSRDVTLIEKEVESQKGQNDEDTTETSNGVEVGKTRTLLNGAEKGDKEQEFVRLNSVRKDSKDLANAISLTESQESYQVKASVPDPKNVIPAEETKVVENETKIEEKEFIHKTFPLSNSSVEESKVDSEKEEKFFEISTSSTAPTAANTNKGGVLLECHLSPSLSDKDKVKDKVDAEMKGKSDDRHNIAKSVLSPNHIVSEFLTIGTSIQLEEFGISKDCSQVNEPTPEATYSTVGYDSNLLNETAKNNESSNTELNQEDLRTKVEVKAGSSFHVDRGIANTEVPVMGPQKQDSEKNPLMHPTVSVEPKQSVESFITESKAELIPSYNLLKLDATNVESDRIPLLNQEKTPKNNVRNPIVETAFAALEPEERSVEKKVIALERTSTEKLKAPLLNFMREENQVLESPNKQERIVGNEEVIDTSLVERKKQKPKYPFFSNCICCTAVTQ